MTSFGCLYSNFEITKVCVPILKKALTWVIFEHIDPFLKNLGYLLIGQMNKNIMTMHKSILCSNKVDKEKVLFQPRKSTYYENKNTSNIVHNLSTAPVKFGVNYKRIVKIMDKCSFLREKSKNKMSRYF